MTVRIGCPNCKASLSMPETMYGRQVKCPKCQQPFQCPSGPEPAVNPQYQAGGGNPLAFDAGTPSSPPRSQDALAFGEQPGSSGRMTGGWGRVDRSLLWHFIAAGCFLVAFNVFYIPLVTSDPMKAKPGDGKWPTTIMLVLLLVGAIIAAIGESCCCSAPRDSGARGPAQTSAVLMVVGIFCGMFVTFIALGQLHSETPKPLSKEMAELLPLLTLVYPSMIAVSFLVFQFFLVLAGSYLRSRALVSNTIGLATFFFLCPIIFFGLTYVRQQMGGGGRFRGGEEDGKFIKWLPVILLVINIAWFCSVLLSLKKAIFRANRNASL